MLICMYSGPPTGTSFVQPRELTANRPICSALRGRARNAPPSVTVVAVMGREPSRRRSLIEEVHFGMTVPVAIAAAGELPSRLAIRTPIFRYRNVPDVGTAL